MFRDAFGRADRSRINFRSKQIFSREKFNHSFSLKYAIIKRRHYAAKSILDFFYDFGFVGGCRSAADVVNYYHAADFVFELVDCLQKRLVRVKTSAFR